MKDGFLRVATHSPTVRVGDCQYNAEQIAAAVLADDACALHVFPELCLTGATCGDLFRQTVLLRGAEEALAYLLKQTRDCDTLIVVGLPVAVGGSLYNCAAVCHAGVLLGLVPKSPLSVAESRWFTDGTGTSNAVCVAGQPTVLCADAIFPCATLSDFCLGVEIGDSLLAVNQPSNRLTAAGATVIANPSAIPMTASPKIDYKCGIIKAQSMRLHCAYVLANAGAGECVADVVYTGGGMIADNGIQKVNTLYVGDGRAHTSAQIDVQHLVYDRRLRLQTATPDVTQIPFEMTLRETPFSEKPDRKPYISSEAWDKARCYDETLRLQAIALARRLAHTNGEAVVGLSGGLDSTLALLVIARAYRLLGRDSQGAVAVTMPCFGTTDRTYNNACQLAKSCGVTLREVNIAAAVTQHLSDIEHSGALDVTYENAQARERTQVLMDIANQIGGLVVGTGDLSELVLGWATYNGDHMSMYSVNASIPKTLVRELVEFEANTTRDETLHAVLTDILDTPVSPELLPPENGTISQKTEQIVGNYDLHDFFMYHILRYGSNPAKVYRLACAAFEGQFEPIEIKQWLCVFLRRFFSQQFKRNCLPDGAAVGSIAVSPRGGLVMPSDAMATLWLNEAEML